MELRHLRYFIAVAEEGSFTRAAARLGIGQSPLSQQIRGLEGEVGTRLFRRVAHGAELTPAGVAFLAEVRDLPSATTRAMHAAHRAARGELGVLNSGFTPSSAFNPAVTGTLRTFRDSYGGVHVHLVENNTAGLLAGLGDGTLDAAFVRPEAAGSGQFDLLPLAEEPMLAALPARHPAASAAGITVQDLARSPLLMFPREAGPVLFDTVAALFRAAQVEPVMGQTVPQVSSILNFVAASLGVSVVPACMATVELDGICYRPITDAHPVARIALAMRRGDRRPIVRNLVACATATVARTKRSLRRTR